MPVQGIGGRNFILAGTCASLSDRVKSSDIISPRAIQLRSGAMDEYIRRDGFTPEADDHLFEQLRRYAANNNHTFIDDISHVSTDAFYGFGAELDQDGQAVYAGHELKGGRTPVALTDLLDDNKVDTLDMEIAPFYTLGGLLKDCHYLAIKYPSNSIPWDASFNGDTIESALGRSIKLSLDFILSGISEGESN